MTPDLSKQEALGTLDFIEELVRVLGPLERGGGRPLAALRSLVPVMRDTIACDAPVRREWVIRAGVDLALTAGGPKKFSVRRNDD